MGLVPGEQPTVEDLLWGLLLPSGNDAAETLADGVSGGSVDRFVGWMNDKARDLGLQDTHFRNPHGLDEDGHYSSAFDLTVMARQVLEHPLLAQIVASTGHNLKVGNWVFFLVNTNRLLGHGGIPGADGVKTGFTDNAGDSLIGSATRGGHRVIVAALGTNLERVPVAASLIEYAFSAYTWVPLGTPAFARWQDAGGTGLRTLTGVQRTAMVLRWQLPYLGAVPDMLPTSESAARSGGAVGRLTYRAGIEPLIDLPLFLQQDGTRAVKAERGS